MSPDEKFMREAIRLARRGSGKTHPNPAVGCVIVRRGKIIGRGWHRRAGLPHAEIEALRSLENPSLARGATVYATLEPCSTTGRTPPCTAALIEAGIGRLVIGATDPNPKHRGRAIPVLKRAGVAVTTGVLQEECAALNPEFHYFMETGLPWVIAKCGMSLDGRLTRPPGEGQWITSKEARADAMKLRAKVDAILVGAATVRSDDPKLTIRGMGSFPHPLRAVWAPRRLPPRQTKLMRDRDKTILLRHKSLRAALGSLARKGIMKVLVEGGGHTLGCVFDQGLAQEVVFYVAPLMSGGSVAAVGGRGIKRAADAVSIIDPAYRIIGGCIRISGRLRQ